MMKNILTIILLVFANSTFAQITSISVTPDSVVLRNTNTGFTKIFTQIGFLEAEPATGKFTIAGSGYSNNFYQVNLASLSVNGVVTPLTFDNVFSNLKSFASTHGAGGGSVAATSPTPTVFATVVSSTSGTDIAIPANFKTGFIEWTNAGTGTVTITTVGGGSTVLTSDNFTRSWLPVETKLYNGVTVTLAGGATIQWSFNN